MMRVIIEIHPRGDSAEKRTVAQVDVFNVSPAGTELCEYEVEADICGKRLRGRVHDHLRVHGAIRLAARALGQVHALAQHETPPIPPPEEPRKL